LLMISAVRRSCPPAGMSGWCMCKATAAALLILPQSVRLPGRYRAFAALSKSVFSMTPSQPQMFGSPLTNSWSSVMAASPQFFRCTTAMYAG
jgi:hypothetical protein